MNSTNEKYVDSDIWYRSKLGVAKIDGDIVTEDKDVRQLFAPINGINGLCP